MVVTTDDDEVFQPTGYKEFVLYGETRDRQSAEKCLLGWSGKEMLGRSEQFLRACSSSPGPHSGQTPKSLRPHPVNRGAGCLGGR